MQDELGLEGVEYYRCGINPEHFCEIPAAPVPIKPKDPRAKEFIKRYGKTAYELDAFESGRLRELVRENIAFFTDMAAYDSNNEQSAEDQEKIEMWADDLRDVAADLAYKWGI
jgi:hypothetical protein